MNDVLDGVGLCHCRCVLFHISSSIALKDVEVSEMTRTCPFITTALSSHATFNAHSALATRRVCQPRTLSLSLNSVAHLWLFITDVMLRTLHKYISICYTAFPFYWVLALLHITVYQYFVVFVECWYYTWTKKLTATFWKRFQKWQRFTMTEITITIRNRFDRHRVEDNAEIPKKDSDHRSITYTHQNKRKMCTTREGAIY